MFGSRMFGTTMWGSLGAQPFVAAAPCRTYTVPFEDRFFAVAFENRFDVVPFENRFDDIAFEDRYDRIERETRSTKPTCRTS